VTGPDNAAHPEHPYVNPCIVTVSVMLATFMELLDTTVVNVSIPHIAGNLAASVDEGTWVVTSYLVSNAVILPMSGWLARRLGRKRLLLICVTGFTLTSFLCGMANSLSALILFRILQGLTGGGLQPPRASHPPRNLPAPEARASHGGLRHRHPARPHPRPHARRLDHRQLFLALDLLSEPSRRRPVDPDGLALRLRSALHPQRRRRTHRPLGIGFLALGLGTLQIVLDTGQKNDWFESTYIRVLAILCVCGLLSLIIRELKARDPVVDLRALTDRSFATGVFLITQLGFVLYASLVLLQIYLQTLSAILRTTPGSHSRPEASAPW
jgi:MFS transporter, DHA2 family, multidrug resistance protein